MTRRDQASTRPKGKGGSPDQKDSPELRINGKSLSRNGCSNTAVNAKYSPPDSISRGVPGKIPKLCSWGFSVVELSVLFRTSPAVKSYWLNKEKFLLLDDVLYQKVQEREDIRSVMPKGLNGRLFLLSISYHLQGIRV